MIVYIKNENSLKVDFSKNIAHYKIISKCKGYMNFILLKRPRISFWLIQMFFITLNLKNYNTAIMLKKKINLLLNQDNNKWRWIVLCNLQLKSS